MGAYCVKSKIWLWYTRTHPGYHLPIPTSLEQGKLPNDWLQAHIVPVFKKGDKNTASNYWPVSLTSILCKTPEHIVNSSIMKHLDIHKILSDSQHGFRARRSCEKPSC